ncbi:single-stranded DNA-binding protein [Treponema brennaborense]|uniref:Single-stranded DNA-binding protein n=1 Tax=Treponema brennaborense (strain DSM 12168 / CIP 105900 / DD5/3) TaxID=906968 RepID=F4LPJ2_TREBD|nr:single-stranded DNA-binding protein [Treponema brennaborense]AEE16003.1 single-strand binding protein [Treponema brennaborense DSM 12168]
MDDFNSIVVEGNLVRDPVVKETPKGSRVCAMSIAVNRYYKDSEGDKQKEVSFFDIETWGTLAEACGKYCDKGRGIRVVGRLKQNRWQDMEGKTQSRVKIVAEHVDFKPKFIKDKSADDSENGSAKQDLLDLAEAAAAQHEAQNTDEPDTDIPAVF